MYQHYFFDKMKKTEAKMHAQQKSRTRTIGVAYGEKYMNWNKKIKFY